jgi:FG-GAP-like repeat
MNAQVTDQCPNCPAATTVTPRLVPPYLDGRPAARIAALVTLALAVSLAGCGGGGGGCGLAGLGGCPVPQTEISIDVAVADLNGDGRPDVVQPIWLDVNGPGTIATWLQSNAGYGPRHDFSAGPTPAYVVAADLNGDDLPDVITSTADGKAVVVLLNDPAHPGALSVSQTLSVMNPSRVAVADLDGDGLPDLVIPGDDLYVALQSTGTPGNFAPPISLLSKPAGAAVAAVAAGDLNGDGVADIVEADQSGVSVLFLSRTPQGVAVASTLPVYASSKTFGVAAVAVADVDGDGRNDVIIVDQDSNEVIVLLQSPAAPGTFLPPHSYPMPGSGQHSRIVAADLNGDGHPDLVVDGTDDMLVLLQDASHPGTFLPADLYAAPIGADGLGVADLNGDGLPDIVTSSGSGSERSLVNGVLSSPPGVYFQDPSNPGHFLAVQDLPHS